MDIEKSQLNKAYPEGTVFTMLKFELSNRDKKTYVGFVSQDTKTGQFFGRKADDRYPKRIVLVDPKLNYLIIPGVLYRCTLIPMKERKGYIAIEATPYQFKATIKTEYIPKAVYQITIRFGQKRILFDPKDGHKASVRSISGVINELSRRLDIENVEDVIRDFKYHANILVERFRKDGYYGKTE